jgi:hypothetical protein
MESLPYISKIPCPPQADCRELQYWNLRFICNLVLGIWDLGMRLWDGGSLEPDRIFSGISDISDHFCSL